MIWVVLLFLGIHQIEGHIVVPKVMGSALRLHPLLVIFGLLAGANIDGLLGALIALPLLAVGRAVWEFFAERVTFEPWSGGGPVPVEVEPVEPSSPSSVAGALRDGRRMPYPSRDERVPGHPPPPAAPDAARCATSSARRRSRSTTS